jgi:hypothetical protein
MQVVIGLCQAALHTSEWLERCDFFAVRISTQQLLTGQLFLVLQAPMKCSWLCNLLLLGTAQQYFC